MYYSHFGLDGPPFKITPNTDCFFTGSNRGAVLDALTYAITQGEGIIKVVGEVGSGKTMLCRMLQTILPAHIERIYLANPSVAPEDILYAIAFELQLQIPDRADHLTVLQILQTHLLHRHAEGFQVVIFIEEAQGMPLATLEEIRLLSNLETKQDKLLQMVLFGQPELDDNLNQPHIRQLRERITHSFHLAPMLKQDVQAYLMFRLRAAGYRGPPLFSTRAINALTTAAQGLVRRVNILADKALLAAFAENSYEVTPKHVRAAIQDTAFGASRTKRSGLWQGSYRWLIGASVIVAVMGAGGLASGILGAGWQGGLAHVVPWLDASQISVKATQQEDTDNTLAVLTQVEASHATTALRDDEPIISDTTAAIERVGDVNNSMVIEKPVTEKTVTENTAMPMETDENVSLEDARAQRTTAWLLTQPMDWYTLQIKSIARADAVAGELTQMQRSVGIDDVYLYTMNKNGRQYTIMLYGLYPTRREALIAMQNLPESIKINQPYFRTIGGIMRDVSAM